MFMDAILNANIERGHELAQRLARPGDILGGVDALTGSEQSNQLGMIDDVTSREFDFWTNTERAEIQPDLNAFDRIDSALTAPTPQPGFMALNNPDRKRLHGITVDHQETWMIGGYNDSR